MANKRVYYACRSFEVANVNTSGTIDTYFIPHGIQSVGITTNFNIEKIFQLGQLATYDQVANNPQVELAVNKVIDGTRPLLLTLMADSHATTSGSLVTMQDNKVNVKMGIYPDVDVLTSGTNPVSTLACTGMYLNNITITLPPEGNFTEEGTLVGDNKTWVSGTSTTIVNDGYGVNTTIAGAGAGFTHETTAPSTSRRYKLHRTLSIFPTGDGGMRGVGANSTGLPPLTSISVSCDFGRETVYSLGSYDPYMRYISFPVDVTTEIETIATDGDYINMGPSQFSCGSQSGFLKNFPIKLTICGSGNNNEDLFVIDLGTHNKIQSINYAGGDTGGGNMTMTYSFQNSSQLDIITSGTFQKSVASGLV